MSPPRPRTVAVACAAFGVLVAARCSRPPNGPPEPRAGGDATIGPAPDIAPAQDAADEAPYLDATGALLDAASDAPDDADLADIDAEPPDDPMALHQDTRAGLLALIDLRDFTPAQLKVVRPDIFLRLNVGPAVTRMNQGNKAIAHHAIGRRACLRGLQGVVLQTPEQRARCGAPYMVPIYKKGDPKSAHYCMDIFEFPDKPCELPFVWAAPTHAATMCALQGKRLCTEAEWNLACRADPAGGADTTYAYGDELDLTICNTDKPRGASNKCRPATAKMAWETCSTDTEPSGAFPRCRSRFGVYDQHGNVAEIMTRHDKNGTLVSQLKGSAFFYAEVAQKPGERGRPGSYPDHCNFDPRWHVEAMDHAWHVNYHLGFRCCKSIPPEP